MTDPPAGEVHLTRRTRAARLRYLAGKLASGGAAAGSVAVALEVLASEMEEPAPRWEYMTIGQSGGWGLGTTLTSGDIAMLNDLGAEGWEVIPPWGMMFCLLRRPAPPGD